MTRDESLTKVTTGEPFLQTEIETPRIRGGKQCGFGGVGGDRMARAAAEEQWTETPASLAAAEHGPCRDFFH